MFKGLLADLSQDVRFAARSLLRQPQFTLTTVLVLALAIGATTAIFTVVNAVLLRPLPYVEPSRLVAVTSVLRSGAETRPVRVVPLSDLVEWKSQTRLLTAMGAFAYTQLPIRVGQQPYSPVTALVDAGFLPALGNPPGRGTFFDEAADRSGERSAILSHAFWREAFAADPSVIGRPFLVDGEPYTVRGVLAAGFQFPRSDASYYTRPIELVILSSSFPAFPPQARQWFGIARLGPGVTLEQADAELRSIAEAAGPRPNGDIWSTRLAPLHEETTRSARLPVTTVFAIAVVLLLIASTNLMNLLVSRGAARGRELSIRKALGSTTGRLVRLLMTESLLLALAGGALGVMLARLTINGLVAMSPVQLPVTREIGIDTTVLVFTAVLCTLTALVVGAIPAIHASSRSEAAMRHAGLRVSAGRGAVRWQQALCTAQIALGVTLVAAAGLLAHSLLRLSAVDPGFETERVIGFNMSVPTGAPLEQRRLFYTRALDEVRTIPGVESAGLITFLPPEVRAGVFMGIAIEGSASADASRQPRNANTLVASADYFATMRMPLARGREFTAADRIGSQPVIIVNETFAQRYFSTTDVIGRRIGTGFDGLEPIREIIGVVSDSRDRGLARAPSPTVYIPFTQFALPYTSMAVRLNAAPETVTSVIRDRLTRLNPDVPLTDFQSVETRIAESFREPRFYTLLAVVCASMAVLFVTLGLYGLISYSVSRRTSELGVRMALGAQRRTILRLVLLQGLRMGGAGVILGIALSIVSSRALTSLLFQVEPIDPWTLSLAAALVLLITLLASYGPARRAAGVDPLIALRAE